jgi:hypothetical protein
LLRLLPLILLLLILILLLLSLLMLRMLRRLLLQRRRRWLDVLHLRLLLLHDRVLGVLVHDVAERRHERFSWRAGRRALHGRHGRALRALPCERRLVSGVRRRQRRRPVHAVVAWPGSCACRAACARGRRAAQGGGRRVGA